MAATIEEKDRNPMRPPDGTKISAIKSASPTPIKIAAQNTGDIFRWPTAANLKSESRNPKRLRKQTAETGKPHGTAHYNDLNLRTRHASSERIAPAGRIIFSM